MIDFQPERVRAEEEWNRKRYATLPSWRAIALILAVEITVLYFLLP